MWGFCRVGVVKATQTTTNMECAYCCLPRKLSREHIWPNGFLRRGNFQIKYSAKAKRTFKGDLIVKDVCEVCNSGPLSQLDKYACDLYDSNFRLFPEHLTPVRFSFEYGALTRWLLKIAFNSARAQGHEDAELLGHYRQCLLADGDICPLYVNFLIALVGPGTLTSNSGRPDKRIYPQAARSGPMLVPNVNGYQHVSTRVVMINGYFFTLILSRTPVMPANEVVDLLQRIPGEPLALNGDMELMTSMNANQALLGVRDWLGNVKENR
jgi:hypothetical protein